MPSYETERVVAVVIARIGEDEDYPVGVSVNILTQTFEPFPRVGDKIIMEYIWLDDD